ncbi:MAG: hypothetical protein HY720_08775 [Planctomycetes bacterium]|nr:hypothetical protein [Planctomycetota bacterium]
MTLADRARALGRVETVWLALPVFAAVLRVFLTPIEPADSWYHLAIGRTIVAEGAIPRTDRFSFTRAGESHFEQSWLADVVLYTTHRTLGNEGLVVLAALVVAASQVLLLGVLLARGADARAAALLGILWVALAGNNWNVRPQTFTIPLFLGLLAVLDRHRRDGKGPLWFIPVLLALWANLHGSFPIGATLIGIACFAEGTRRLLRRAGTLDPSAWRRLVLWSALGILALAANPRGFEVFRYVAGVSGHHVVRARMEEWTPAGVAEPAGALFLCYAVLWAALHAGARRTPTLEDALRFFVFLPLALSMRRAILWFSIASLPALGTLATFMLAGRSRSSRFRPAARERPAANAVLLSLLVLLTAAASPWTKPRLGLDPAVGSLVSPETPVAATEALARDRGRPERVFHSMEAGSWIVWAAPEVKVFVDPRIELYPEELWEDYLALSRGERVEELLAKYEVNGLLLSRAGEAALLAAVLASGEWDIRHEDGAAVYLVRWAGR